jgi:hypothetical protein
MPTLPSGAARELTNAEFKLYVAAYCEYRDGATGLCTLAHATIERVTGICRTDVTRLKRGLAQKGWVALVGDHVLVLKGYERTHDSVPGLSALGWRQAGGGVWENRRLALRSRAVGEPRPPRLEAGAANGGGAKAAGNGLAKGHRAGAGARAATDNRKDHHSLKYDGHTLENDCPSLSDGPNHSVKNDSHTLENDSGPPHVRNLMTKTTTTPLPPRGGESVGGGESPVARAPEESPPGTSQTVCSRHPYQTLLRYGWANVPRGIKNPVAWAKAALGSGRYDGEVDVWLETLLLSEGAPSDTGPAAPARRQAKAAPDPDCPQCRGMGWFEPERGKGVKQCGCAAGAASKCHALPAAPAG